MNSSQPNWKNILVLVDKKEQNFSNGETKEGANI
jgi:hypothetical protein